MVKLKHVRASSSRNVNKRFTINKIKTSTYASLCLFFYVAHLTHKKCKALNLLRWSFINSTNVAQLAYTLQTRNRMN